MTICGGWEAIRQVVRQRVGPAAFDAWFRSLEGSLDGDSLVLRCPDRFSRDWIRGKYGRLLQETAPHTCTIEYRVPSLEDGAERAADLPRNDAMRTDTDTGALHGDSPEEEGPTLESFMVGPCNALALEAARSVAGREAGRCSPLVLYGGSGVGKTHLCRAIQHKLGPDALYRSSEEFTSEVTQGIRRDRMPSVRHRYRRALNVLILEDVQFLRGRRATQVELFHTLDHLISKRKSVVLTADRPPHELEGMDRRLVSRIASGLVAQITPPELPTRRAILRAKAAGGGVRIPPAALELLAQRPVDSTRDLLAGLNQVVARAALLKRPISVELVREALAAVEGPERCWSLDQIVGLVARTYAVEVSELRGRSRKRRITRPRQLAMYLCRRCTQASLKEIGDALNRDHTSVIYAIDAVERRAVEQPQLRYELETLATRLRSFSR